MIRFGADPHIVLTEALQQCTVRGRSPVIVKSRLSHWHAKHRIIRLLMVIMALPPMVFDIWMSVLRGKPVVVREFWNLPMAIISPLLWPIRTRVLFNINHNLSDLPANFPLTLQLMAWMGFRFVLFDGAAVVRHFPLGVRNAFYFPLFPCIAKVHSKRQFDRPVLAVAGDFRPEKGSPEAIRSVLIALARDQRWRFRIGRHGQRASLFDAGDAIETVDTSTYADYVRFLTDADIVLVFADPSKYYIRHSGTVMDAIACGAVPVVPDLPVIASQVSDPNAVGTIYQTMSDIESCVVKVISEMSVYAQNRGAYLATRRRIELTECGRHD